MTKATNYLPAGSHSVTPHLTLKNAAQAIEFYKKAFGAEEIYRLPMPNGKIAHASIKIGDSRIYLTDEISKECGGTSLGPDSLKGAHATIHLYTPNVDETFQHAVDAGAKAEMPPQDMFWGDRYGRITDPFGQPWSLATHIEDLTPEEITKRGAECMKQPVPAK